MDEQLASSKPSMLGKYAGFVTRMIAFIIDSLILSVIAFFALASIEWLVNAFQINQLLGLLDFSPQVRAIVGTVIYLALVVTYNMGLWLLTGQTIGKRIMGVRILRTSGERINFWNALRRQIGYVISGILFLGYIWILFDNRRQGFHDKMAGTIVVFTWPEEELKGTFVMDRLRQARFRGRGAAPPEG
jgi:uncharacterized RDD family membrane protein YckC